MPGNSLETALSTKRSGKMRKEMLKSSLKAEITGDKWTLFFPKRENYISSVALQRTGTEKFKVSESLKQINKPLFFFFPLSVCPSLSPILCLGQWQSVHCTPRALFRLKALPYTEIPIFQFIVNKCGSFYRCKKKSNTFTDSRPLCFSPRF